MVHTGTDFAHQHGLLISNAKYNELFAPFHKKVNDWIHTHTNWKTFMHCCGSVVNLLPDIIRAGFDIINPVQVSADNMDPRVLKDKFGKDIVFWGGGCDPQHVMPQGTPYGVPAENFLAEIKALKDTVPQAK